MNWGSAVTCAEPVEVAIEVHAVAFSHPVPNMDPERIASQCGFPPTF